MEQANSQHVDRDGEPQGPIGLAATRPGVILRFDRSRRIRFVSPSIQAATGFSPEQVLGRTHRELGYPDDMARIWEDGIDRVFATGAETTLRCNFPLGDVPRDFFVHLAPELDAEGAVTTVLGAARDISEELRAERELRVSEARYRLLADNASDLISLSELTDRVLYMSPAVERLLGAPPEHYVGTRGSALLHPDDLARSARETMEALQAGREIPPQLNRTRHVDGRWIWLETISRIVHEPSLSDQPLILAISRDVSERQRIESELKERDRLLAEAQRVARLGFWEWWPETGEVTWTDELYRLLGYEPGAVQPSLEAFQAKLRPEDVPAARQGLDQRFAERGAFNYEHHVVGADGTLRLLTGHGQAELDDAGRVVRLFGTTQDVTERRAIEDEMARRTAALEQAREIDRVKSQFVGSVSHELRTPLSSIQGYAELLVDGVGGPLTAPQQKFVEQIERGARRLASLVDDLLDFALLEAGTFRFRFADEDIADKLREVLESFEPLACEAGITLETHLPAGGLRLYCDAYRVGQVLINLVGNALKFTPRGGRVDVRADRAAGGLRVEVVDSGAGIAPEDQAKLFRRFAQLDASNTRVAGGTGLGLSISKAIVEGHGGTIGLTSEPGRGSTFWFTLPLGGPDRS